MNNGVMTGLSGLFVIFLIVLAVLWFLLPFAVFGVKDLLQQMLYETKKTNELLAQLQKIAPLESPRHYTTHQDKTDDVIAGG